MKTVLKSIVAAALVVGVSGTAMAKSAPAADAGLGGVNGIATANFDQVVVASNAFKAAQAQRETQFKPQIDQARARETQINTELKGLIEKFNKDRAAGVAQATLQGEAQHIQEIQGKGKAELDKIVEPLRLSDAYVLEQILDKRDSVTQAAMSKAGITLLLTPEAVQASTRAYSLDATMLAELNTQVPSVQIVPPAGWLPRQLREQQGAQAPAAGAASGADGR